MKKKVGFFDIVCDMANILLEVWYKKNWWKQFNYKGLLAFFTTWCFIIVHDPIQAFIIRTCLCEKIIPLVYTFILLKTFKSLGAYFPCAYENCVVWTSSCVKVLASKLPKIINEIWLNQVR